MDGADAGRLRARHLHRNDGKSGTATDTVTIQVIKPPVKDYTFEDVHFDFDRYSLRPEAVRILDEAIRAMQ